jgi:sugar transferase (PEP-CTERM/EpsH1 system associated)
VTSVTSNTTPLVLHVVHHLIMGGMENGVVNLINNMPAEQYRHAIACIEGYSDFRHRITRPDVQVFALNRSHIGVWRVRQELYRLCRRIRPTIVHSRNLSGLDALLPSKLAGVPYRVHGEHGWDVDDLKGEKSKPVILRKLHSPLISRYITVSRDLQRYLCERVGVAPARITQIYNGVDTDRFDQTKPIPPDLLPENFRDPNRIVIGTVGRAQPVKDQATLLRAFAALVDSHPSMRERLRLAVVGDGPVLADLRELANSLNIAELTWVPGALNNIPDVLRALDLFVLPSLNEGISNTILEAMSAGVPLIVSAVGGNVELIDDGVFGRFFKSGDVETLSKLMGDYVADEALRKVHGVAARRVALERYSMKAMIQNYQGVYDHLHRSMPLPH